MKTKEQARTYFRALRNELTPIQRMEQSERIVEQYMPCFEKEKPKVVHLFLPIEPLLEINTLLLLEKLNTQYSSVKTVTSIIAEDQHSLLTVEVRNDMTLVKNAWGISEPSERIFCDEKEIDEVLTPLLAVDVKGYRLGYGKGFYDRFFLLCATNVKKTGLNYFKPVEEVLPKDNWDVPLTRLISPEGVVCF